MGPTKKYELNWTYTKYPQTLRFRTIISNVKVLFCDISSLFKISHVELL